MRREIQVSESAAGLRIDTFLAAELTDTSRNTIQRAIAGGGVVFADGRHVKKNHIVAIGDCFFYTQTEPAPLTAAPEDIPLEIVYEDSAVLVVNKTRGMVTHPAPGHPGGTLVNALVHHCGAALSDTGDPVRPGIVHRLDKDTSGLLLVAKTDSAHCALARQLKERTLSRIYEAVVIGRVGLDSGCIDQTIGRHPTDRKRQSIHSRTPRAAVTHFQVLTRYNGYTHLQAQLETGRTHQIRVHLASIGHPVLGDLLYGRKRPEKGLSGQCLHAKSLLFTHPQTGAQMEVTSELPPYFTTALSKLGVGE